MSHPSSKLFANEVEVIVEISLQSGPRLQDELFTSTAGRVEGSRLTFKGKILY